jgi:drug/metabolite transporter (DMT)-like permease
VSSDSVFLFTLSLLAAFVGVVVLAAGDGAIPGLVLLLIAAVLFVGSPVLDRLDAILRELQAEQPPTAPSQTKSPPRLRRTAATGSMTGAE